MPNEIPADAKRQVLLGYKSMDNQVRLKTLDDTCSYDALGYPLFIAGGADSWCLDYSKCSKKDNIKCICELLDDEVSTTTTIQTKLQWELYHGVQDATQAGDLSNVGTPVILPATVTG